MQSDQNPKQLVVERVKKATNILVTVGRNPSVDALSAALGLTLMLNKMDKHATAVFSGTTPSAIDFLKPAKTFENTVDSLRDFIIALDKEKADRLRYKVEDDVVRIFITPYRTVISEQDLKFSQGDFNVDLIVALDVDKKEDLDTAVTAHGRILHDAALVSICTAERPNNLGGIDWTDEKSSSLSEMLMSLSEALQSGILDEQIATALLTGIVAATERFRNDRTNPKVMTMAAQLMAAGANQQLIAENLDEAKEEIAEKLSEPVRGAAVPVDGTTKLQEGASEKIKKLDEKPVEPTPEPAKKAAPVVVTPELVEPAKEKPKRDGEMQIQHDEALPEPPKLPAIEPVVASVEETKLEDEMTKAAPATPTLSVADIQKDLAAANEELEADDPNKEDSSQANPALPAEEPTFSGTFNATADAAAEEKRQAAEVNRNRTLLSHDATADGSAPKAAPSIPEPSAFNSAGYRDEPPTIDPFAQPVTSQDSQDKPSRPLTIIELEQQARELEKEKQAAQEDGSVESARAAVDAAIASQFDPAHNPAASVGAQPMEYIEAPLPGDSPAPLANEPAPAVPDEVAPGLPPLPDFSTLPPLPTEPAPVDSAAPVDNSTQPAAPSFETLPPLPGEPVQAVQPESPQTSQPPSNDPGQFRLPGQ